MTWELSWLDYIENKPKRKKSGRSRYGSTEHFRQYKHKNPKNKHIGLTYRPLGGYVKNSPAVTYMDNPLDVRWDDYAEEEKYPRQNGSELPPEEKIIIKRKVRYIAEGIL